jgi:lysosomal acid phosphatase
LNFARTPGTYLVNDKNYQFWENYGGFSQQTPLGKEQIYNFGKFLKEKYNYFLSQNYSSKKVYVRSIDTDRSLSSISAFIYGMYPDLSNNASVQWSSGSHWIPIPIHTDDLNSDPVSIKIFKSKCLHFV